MTTKAAKAKAETKPEATADETEAVRTYSASDFAILEPFVDLIASYQAGETDLDTLKAAVEEPAEVTIGEEQFNVSAITMDLRDGQRIHIRRKQVLGEFVVAEARLSPG